MKGKRGLAPRIVSMFEQGYTVPDIAKAVGCSRENVHKVLARKGIHARRAAWNGYITTLPQKHEEWLVREAKRTGVTRSELARALLVDAIELAIEEDADLRCKSTTNAFERTPLPRHWKAPAGNLRTPKTSSGFAARARGSASVGT